ncbi:MAG TPA: phosphopantetheine-binding protein [Acidobacteriota bacterium]|nr:phosphopantetheine-binding protein [Acidobacteriota bacterium]
MSKPDQLVPRIRQVLLRLRPSIGDQVGLSDDLFALGLDSQAVVEFVLRLEDETGVEFELEDISLDSFRTIGSIEHLLKRKVVETST